MDILEYEKVRELNYLEYCDYLQNKYGIGLSDYMTPTWNRKKKVSRTNEGLLAHHKFEDHAIKLSTKEFAIKNPYEWQLAKNIIYCDYLEHLYLHILICESSVDNYTKETDALEMVGIGGILEFLVPELNGLYSGWKTSQAWRMKCHELVINDKNVYLTLLKRFKVTLEKYQLFTDSCLFSSYNDSFGLWSERQNFDLFKEIYDL